jgi:PRTRC genetic system protein A
LQTTNSRVLTGLEIAGYVLLRNRDSYDFTQPPIGQLCDYLFAFDGIYLRALRPGLSVLLKIHDCEIRGLAPLGEIFPPPVEDQPIEFTLPRVPAGYLQTMLERSIKACVKNGAPVEALFHLIWNEIENRWQLDKPAQEANSGSVRPIHAGAGTSYERALIELHSHHQMDAFFSGTDDEDEQGFRIYAVIGEIFGAPKIRVRVGCFGHFQEIPAETIFQLPNTIADNYEEESTFVEIDEKN